jgi:tetratricopeptide (TPR) repeat protein
MQPDFDKDLLAYFTNVDRLRELFKASVAAPTLTKRLLIIHGVGGVGKSSLLRVLRLHCKSGNFPVALASGDEAKSALDVLVRWTDDLKAEKFVFPSFGKAFEHYRAIQVKVYEQAAKAKDARRRLADFAGKAASKTAETTGGALAGAVIGSVIPGIGTAIGGALGGVLGGMGAEALLDWLRGFLKQSDIDLLLDPAKKLTEHFLADLALAENERRTVLMVDTFEQMSALEDWTRDIAQRLPVNILLVITGRAIPNWNRAWPSWMAHSHVEELKPMSEDDMRELVRRYYATMRGGEPNPEQVEAIIRFARGLPMVVTSAVQLWVKYGVEDFQSVKTEIVANLVDRLMEGVPNELIPALEAAAIVRWFDQPILRAVMGLADVREVYNELRRFPFVRVRIEGLALHEAVREIMDENLHAQDSDRYCELHERAVVYFEKRLEKTTGVEAERLGLERLYHTVHAEEEAGIKLFQEMAEEMVRYRFINRLRALLNDANMYPLEHENSRLWRDYYGARLAYLEMRLKDAEKVYEAVSKNISAEPKLRAYALHDLGLMLSYRHTWNSDVVKRSISCFEQSLNSGVLDYKLASGLTEIATIQRDAEGNWDKALENHRRELDFYLKHGSQYDLALSYVRLRNFYAYQGNWAQMIAMQERAVEIIRNLREPPHLQIQAAVQAYWLWLGRCIDVELSARKTLQLTKELGIHSEWRLRDLAAALGFSGKFSESEPLFAEAIDDNRRLASYSSREEAVTIGFYGIVLVKQGKLNKAFEILSRSADIKQNIQDSSFLLETLNWLGIANELAKDWDEANKFYDQNLTKYRWAGRHYFECGALSGLVRVRHAQGDYDVIPHLISEAEQLAQEYEYNDHLASLRLIQGHIAWEGRGNILSPTQQSEMISSLQRYQHALIFALRYNRFLLDEVLSGRPQGSPLLPIIPYCCLRGDEGRKMLIALRDWWKTGINDIGTSRRDTISTIPEGISLLEAERLAREREPGDGSLQESVVEQIEMVLSS